LVICCPFNQQTSEKGSRETETCNHHVQIETSITPEGECRSTSKFSGQSQARLLMPSAQVSVGALGAISGFDQETQMQLVAIQDTFALPVLSMGNIC
jgi:hypothetical protein